MKRVFILLTVFAALAIVFSGCQKAVNPTETTPSLTYTEPDATVEWWEPVCAATPGYWKNHPEAWPVDELLIGGETYDKETMLYWLNQPTKGDKSITLFKALVATLLNKANGADVDCVKDYIQSARGWFKPDNFGPVGSGVKANSMGWQKHGEMIYMWLDDYNNGMLCAPGCD